MRLWEVPRAYPLVLYACGSPTYRPDRYQSADTTHLEDYHDKRTQLAIVLYYSTHDIVDDGYERSKCLFGGVYNETAMTALLIFGRHHTSHVEIAT